MYIYSCSSSEIQFTAKLKFTDTEPNIDKIVAGAHSQQVLRAKQFIFHEIKQIFKVWPKLLNFDMKGGRWCAVLQEMLGL